MDRRKALRNMGLAMGYTVATPTLIGLMQGCKEETILEWTPDFFTKDQGGALTKLVDIIIPKTDTPSASEVQVNLFIDRFADEVMEQRQQDFFKMTMNRFLGRSAKEAGKENLADLTPEDLERTLAKVLKTTKEDREEKFEVIESYNEAIDKGKNITLDDGTAHFAFADGLRGLTIWGYKTSEYVGEKILDYRPVPGEYIPCGDLEQLTGGRAWSLS